MFISTIFIGHVPTSPEQAWNPWKIFFGRRRY